MFNILPESRRVPASQDLNVFCIIYSTSALRLHIWLRMYEIVRVLRCVLSLILL